MKALYTASSCVKGGRNGHIISENMVIDMPLVMPKSLGGAGSIQNNYFPGYTACIDGVLNLAAGKVTN